MSFQKDSSNFKYSSLPSSNMENIESKPWYKEQMKIKRSRSQENLTVSKPIKDSKKKVSISAQNQNQDGKVLKENTNSHKVCYCSPTTHEGSFRCRHHRISATKKSSSEKLINVRCSKFVHEEFKPQLSRFGRVASAENGSQLNSTI
ncbi:hypothetical protein P8452_64443 [Trifolium repens]|nr:hypothetical protein P8452_64443 [Trifolium repens]